MDSYFFLVAVLYLGCGYVATPRTRKFTNQTKGILGSRWHFLRITGDITRWAWNRIMWMVRIQKGLCYIERQVYIYISIHIYIIIYILLLLLLLFIIVIIYYCYYFFFFFLCLFFFLWLLFLFIIYYYIINYSSYYYLFYIYYIILYYIILYYIILYYIILYYILYIIWNTYFVVWMAQNYWLMSYDGSEDQLGGTAQLLQAWSPPTPRWWPGSKMDVFFGTHLGTRKKRGWIQTYEVAIFGWKGRVLNHIQMVFHQRLLSRLTEALSWIATDVSAPSSNNWPGLFLWYSMYPDFCWWFPLSCFPLACGLEHRCILRSMLTASWPERCTSWVGTVLLEGNGRFVWWVIFKL